MALNLAEAVEQIDVDAKSYGEILLTCAAEDNAAAIFIGPAGGATTRVAYRMAEDDPWFDCVPPPAHARQQWLHRLFTDRGLSLSAGERVDGSLVQKQIDGPSLIWQVQADSPDSAILLTRVDGGVAP